jgi:hypothetical protein
MQNQGSSLGLVKDRYHSIANNPDNYIEVQMLAKKFYTPETERELKRLKKLIEIMERVSRDT